MVPSPSHDGLKQWITKSKFAWERAVPCWLCCLVILWIKGFINLIVVLCINVSSQLVQVQKVTLQDVMAQKCQEHFLVGAMGNLLDNVDVTVLWALSAEIIWPAEGNKLTHLVQNAMGLFEFPATFFSGKVDLKDSNTSIDFCCKSSNWMAVIPNFLDCICYSNMDTCASTMLSIGSSIRGLPCRTPLFASRISLLIISIINLRARMSDSM